MMRTIHKYLVPHGYTTDPISHMKVLHVGTDPVTGSVAVWVEVDLELNVNSQSRRFGIFPTGGNVLPGLEHVGSVIQGVLVWHVYSGN